MSTNLPDPLLKARCEIGEDGSDEVLVTTFCVGYERGRWRGTELARHAIRWLPDFTLSSAEREALGVGNAVERIGTAARLVYGTDKYSRRGEFGELFLHALLRQHYSTEPVVLKLHHKTGRNDTVKGFDGVHLTVSEGNELLLWLGEAKFYSDIKAAVREALKSIRDHFDENYLRDEFLLIVSKMEKDFTWRDELSQLLSSERILGDILSSIIVPILVTYDSAAISEHEDVGDEYVAHVEREARSVLEEIQSDGLGDLIQFRVLLLPLESKKALAEELHLRLTSLQRL